jgi:poly-gamma-glutamate synthesis protein (capsule biosynthesis protein)
LDSLQIGHTGTFRDSTDRRKKNLLILGKDSFRIGLLNYTYGTNGLPIPHPAMVNLMDTLQVDKDIQVALQSEPDKLMVFVHWGAEYISTPDKAQMKFADFLFRKGVDIIIGSHPHVIQKMEFYTDSVTRKERFIAWSLGNFVSDQRTIKRDGGVMVSLKIVKDRDSIYICDPGYILTWVYKPVIKGRTKFQVIPCSSYTTIPGLAEDSIASIKCKFFMTSSRELLTSMNVNVKETNHFFPRSMVQY